jgi:putative endonuclease
MKRQALGRRGEDFAASYLESRGLTIVKRNFRTREGEIDLIASQENEIIFVEVKTRRSAGPGETLESIDERKMGKLRKMAEVYLSENGLMESPVRFDVMVLEFVKEESRWRARWIKRAF